MKVLYVRRMMWYVHERRPVIFDGQPPSRSFRDASTPDHGLPEGQWIISVFILRQKRCISPERKKIHTAHLPHVRRLTARATHLRLCGVYRTTSRAVLPKNMGGGVELWKLKHGTNASWMTNNQHLS
jgi:hypothetical protein